MPRSTPTQLALPPFYGATRRLIFLLLGIFFADALLALVLPHAVYFALTSHLPLIPYEVAHGQLWQLVTYAFLPLGLMGTLFALLTLWFVGAMLEDLRGSRWIYELFFTSAIGGAILATAIAWTGLFHLTPLSVGVGPYAAIYGLFVATAMLMGDTEFLFFFVVRIRAKYMVAIYVLIDLAILLKEPGGAFTALLQLSGALCAFLFLRFSPRRGLAFGLTERFYALRNEFYRNKRRRAARKFEVYMSKQGRNVQFDKDGRYVEPDSRPNGKDPNHWVN